MNKSIPEREKEIQKFWEENNIFEKTLEATKKGKAFTFYDGPPFATGTPHYGHLVASVMKDVVPRYWTMKGYYVKRRWGWDCHGLPIENIAEKALGFKSKKDIEDYGIDKFNDFCRSKVLEYVDIWKKTIPRFGRWADMENPYKTMDLSYMESIWWVFKELYDKGLVYEGYKSMHVCPRCETTLSQQEVSEGYRDIKDLSATAKFELVDEPGTFVLAWTTTPWTLPANVALAVGEEIEYVKVKLANEKYILAKKLIEKVFPENELEIIKEFLGGELIGKKYRPLFPYYQSEEAKSKIKNSENIYTIVSADFVTTEDGTGVVHIAPAFGEDDMSLGKEKNLPMIQNVMINGQFKDEVTDFAGMNVKPADDTQKTDVEIIKYLAAKNLLFAKEKYEHSYPHCWRCDTPLINYATSSWFVKVTDIKPKAIELAKEINWSPKHIKDGRFGNWLEGARDWSISRQRFWASVMPIWKCDCGQIDVIGSIEELKKKKIDRNHFYIVRHGESEKNIEQIFDTSKDKYPLTTKGREQVSKVAQQAKKEGIEVIICSEVLRAKETAEIIAKELGVEIVIDQRLNEVFAGELEGQADNTKEIASLINGWSKAYTLPLGTGESLQQVEQRVLSVWKEINQKYQNKKILLVSHGDVLRTLKGIMSGYKTEEIFAKLAMPKNAQLELLPNGIFDLHKDVIDLVEVKCSKCGSQAKRISDVLDTWFDSGSMPYAQEHYPFENKKEFEFQFPVQFIAEGVDQTRAWFYYLHIIASAIKDSRAFSNVIANGIVLAEDGKKMAKRLQNYPEPEIVMEKYGADALRYYLLSSPVMQAENMNFSEAGVKEAMQKIVMLVNNIVNFYQLYEDQSLLLKKVFSENILDKWLMAKLDKLIKDVTAAIEEYDLPRAVRPLQEFIDEFSTWWLRRSRDRFKSENIEDKKQALTIFKFALTELSKLMAPFMPFIAEDLYGKVGAQKESVHLEKWPEALKDVDQKVISDMDQARKIVEMGLAARAEHGIKIRQPLNKLTAYGFELSDELARVVAEEVNIKKVETLKGELKVELDLEITEDLQLEGAARELVRSINDLRKKQNLTIDDTVTVQWMTDSPLLDKLFADQKLVDELRKSTLTSDMIRGDNEGVEININGEKIKLLVQKI